jgi:hypothetical protein
MSTQDDATLGAHYYVLKTSSKCLGTPLLSRAIITAANEVTRTVKLGDLESQREGFRFRFFAL